VRIVRAEGWRRTPGLNVPEQATVYPRVDMYGVLPAHGLYVRHARNVVLRDVELRVEEPDARPALVADDVAELELSAFVGRAAASDQPSVWLHDVRGARVGVDAANDGIPLRVTGKATDGVALVGPEGTPARAQIAAEVELAAVTTETRALLAGR
jgi:hypothetical protein